MSISKSLKCNQSEGPHKIQRSFVGISCSLFIITRICKFLICYLSAGENNICVYICKATLPWRRMRIYCLSSTGNSISFLQIFLEQIFHVSHYGYTNTRISVAWNCKIDTYMHTPTHAHAHATHKHTNVHPPQITNNKAKCVCESPHSVRPPPTRAESSGVTESRLLGD